MVDLPKLSDIDVIGKRVIVRMDLDLPERDYSRLEAGKETLLYLLENKAKIIIIGHKGRPNGEVVEELSLKPLAEVIGNIMGVAVKFIDEVVGEKVIQAIDQLGEGEFLLLENLRFDKKEEENDEGFARQLAGLADLYVNESFAVSHRPHASFVGIPKFLPHAAGIRLAKEVEILSHIIDEPERPLIYLISGIKEDKLGMIEDLVDQADKILVAGRLPEYIEKAEEGHSELISESILNQVQDDKGKIIVAKLNPDKEDITIHSVEKFLDEINKAKTIVLAGVIGKYEDEGQRQGTRKVFEAVAASNAYKIAGGGDTEAALTMFNLTDKFNWISVGGGAMLQFLDKGTLPGLEALIN